MFFLPLFDDNPIKKIPWVTYTIIGLNVLVFLFQSSLSSSELEIFFRENGFISGEFFSNSSLLYSNLYTSLFIHGGFFHLFSNMLYLWIFGDNIEAELGSIKFLIFYLVCGVIASLAQGIVDPDSLIPLIGASGAVAGILGAYLILYPSANVRVFVWIFIFIQIINVPAGIVLAIWIIGQFFSLGSSMSDGVAYMAHVAGFMSGLMYMFLFKKRNKVQTAHHSRPFTRTSFKEAYDQKIYDRSKSKGIKDYN